MAMTHRERDWSSGSLLVAIVTGFFSSGCGASSARLGVGPVLDSDGRVGIESTFSLGFGMPLDYRGRSQHYMQGLAFVGGGADVDTDAKIVTTGIGADYIYWAHPRLDVRAGMYFVYRNREDKPKEHDLLGMGAHVALMPVTTGSDSSIFVPQFCIGPEFRVDQSWDAHSNASRTHFGFPLVMEFNLLAAGD
jgi:hypothetical protein